MQAAALLGISLDESREQLAGLIRERVLVCERLDENTLVFEPRVRAREVRVAAHLRRLQRGPGPQLGPHPALAVKQAEHHLKIALAPSQRRALETLLTHGVCVLTGGPGTGKTTLTRVLSFILQRQNVLISLAAPTGRAARQLRVATGQPAFTLHRLLGAQGDTGQFTRTANQPLDTQCIVVDEMSMVDLELFHALLEATPDRCGLILIGDPDQLPSVGAGNVLHDLLNSPTIPSVRLTEIHRQARNSNIILNTSQIRQGLPPTLDPNADDDFEWLIENDPPTLVKRIVELCTQELPDRFGLDPLRDIQVLTPRRTGTLGAERLNVHLQAVLNPHPVASLVHRGTRFGVGDRVQQQVMNDDTRGVYNGDTGLIERVFVNAHELDVRLFGRLVRYGADELDQLALANAHTVHRAQGSEFPAVIVPIACEQGRLLNRQMLNTALSRAQRRAILIGQERALERALKVHDSSHRLTGLQSRLKQARSAGSN